MITARFARQPVFCRCYQDDKAHGKPGEANADKSCTCHCTRGYGGANCEFLASWIAQEKALTATNALASTRAPKVPARSRTGPPDEEAAAAALGSGIENGSGRKRAGENSDGSGGGSRSGVMVLVVALAVLMVIGIAVVLVALKRHRDERAAQNHPGNDRRNTTPMVSNPLVQRNAYELVASPAGGAPGAEEQPSYGELGGSHQTYGTAAAAAAAAQTSPLGADKAGAGMGNSSTYDSVPGGLPLPDPMLDPARLQARYEAVLLDPVREVADADDADSDYHEMVINGRPRSGSTYEGFREGGGAASGESAL